VNQEHVIIDEVGPHQRLDQFSAPHYQEILARLLFELRDGLRCIAFEQRGIAPWERLL